MDLLEAQAEPYLVFQQVAVAVAQQQWVVAQVQALVVEVEQELAFLVLPAQVVVVVVETTTSQQVVVAVRQVVVLEQSTEMEVLGKQTLEAVVAVQVDL
jgi:hypothetical protein